MQLKFWKHSTSLAFSEKIVFRDVAAQKSWVCEEMDERTVWSVWFISFLGSVIWDKRRHKSLWEQSDITFILTLSPKSYRDIKIKERKIFVSIVLWLWFFKFFLVHLLLFKQIVPDQVVFTPRNWNLFVRWAFMGSALTGKQKLRSITHFWLT